MLGTHSCCRGLVACQEGDAILQCTRSDQTGNSTSSITAALPHHHLVCTLPHPLQLERSRHSSRSRVCRLQSQDLSRFTPHVFIKHILDNSRNTESLLRPPSQRFFLLASECTVELPGVYPGAKRNPKLVWFSNPPSPDAVPAWGKAVENN